MSMLNDKTTIPNARADRLNHLLAETHREIQALYEVDVGVIEIAELGVPIDAVKDEINRHRTDPTFDEGNEMSDTLVQIEGVAYRIRRKGGATTIETPCRCLGEPDAKHDAVDCPWLSQREERMTESDERVEEMEERSHG